MVFRVILTGFLPDGRKLFYGFVRTKAKRFVFLLRLFNFIGTCSKRWIFVRMYATIHTDFDLVSMRRDRMKK